MEEKEYRIHIRLSPYLNKGINEIAKKYGMTKSDVIRLACKDYIQEQKSFKDR